uniref:Uncharacterized protein n=1 Tax=Amphimedon queenslandica TaxID=400682 RepID=A0A1X7V3H9_AMPQE
MGFSNQTSRTTFRGSLGQCFMLDWGDDERQLVDLRPRTEDKYSDRTWYFSTGRKSSRMGCEDNDVSKSIVSESGCHYLHRLKSCHRTDQMDVNILAMRQYR